MAKYTLRRLVQSLVTLWVVSVLVFLLTTVLGDPVAQLLPPTATEADRARLERLLGYDRPLLTQYVDFVTGAVSGDFGESTSFRRSAFSVVMERVHITAGLAVSALALSMLIGVPLGMVAGYRPNGFVDRLSVTVATTGQAVPVFVIAIVLILIFSVRLGWLPAGGISTWYHFILPVVSLALWAMAALTRLTRSGMREAMSKPFVILARAKGLKESEIVVSHAMRNAMLPVITYGGLQLAVLLSGAVVTETVFSIPGVGQLAVEAVRARDLNLVRTVVMLGAVIFLTSNFLTDLSYSLVDPRIRYTEED